MVWKQASDCCAGTAAIYGAPDLVKVSQLFSDTDVSDTVTIHECVQWTLQADAAGFDFLRVSNPAQTFDYIFLSSAIGANRNITLPLLLGNDTIVTECHIATLTGKTFVAPALGTPASGVMTNVTGTAACLTAGNVTTNANLTGDVTSTGNATTIANNAVDTVMIANSQVTYAKIQNVAATNRILGRDSACAGVIEEITPAAVRTMINVECGSTADQTNAQIKTAYEANADTNEFDDAEQTKLAGIETAAKDDQAIAELTDVTVMCLTNCDVIKRIACAWVNSPDTGGCSGICAVVCDTTPCLGGDLTIGANSLIFNSNDASPQAGTVASIYLEGCDLNSNVSACDTHLWRINDVIEMTLSAAALCVAGNITLSGTVDGICIATDVAANTTKVTNATHTGDVTGCVGLTIAAKAVEIAMLDDGTDGELITWSACAVATTVGAGCCGQVLTSGGAGAVPAFANSPAADNLGNHTATMCLILCGNDITTIGNSLMTADETHLIDLTRDTAQADGYVIGEIRFRHDDQGGVLENYARMTGVMNNDLVGAEDGELHIFLTQAGVHDVEYVRMNSHVVFPSGSNIEFLRPPIVTLTGQAVAFATIRNEIVADETTIGIFQMMAQDDASNVTAYGQIIVDVENDDDTCCLEAGSMNFDIRQASAIQVFLEVNKANDNEVKFNMPTGGLFRWDINDVTQMTLNACTITLESNTLQFAACQTIVPDGGGLTYNVPACDTHEFNRCVNLTAGTVQEAGTDISPIGTHTQWIPAGAWGTVTTNGAEFAELELATNDIMLQTFNFDTCTAEKIQFWWEPPAEWNIGTITFNTKWTETGGAACGSVVFELSGHSYTDNDAIDAAIAGTPATSTDTNHNVDNDMQISPCSSAVTIAGATKGEAVLLQIQRVVACDTLSVDAKLIGVNITYTIDEATKD